MDLSDFVLARAVVSAGAYAPERQPSSPPAPPPEVLTHIRRARVQLYCGQDGPAVADIRAAREQLRRCGASLHVVPLQALDAASWLARHGHTVEAEDALEAALARLESASAAG